MISRKTLSALGILIFISVSSTALHNLRAKEHTDFKLVKVFDLNKHGAHVFTFCLFQGNCLFRLEKKTARSCIDGI